jgi:transposase
LHLAVDALGLPVKMIVTDGNAADCSQAEALIDGLHGDCLMADKAYDTNALLDLLESRKTAAVIPPKRNRKDQRAYDKDLYKLRHIIENAFLKFKAWRSIATRYAKTTASFLAECQLAAIMLWLR